MKKMILVLCVIAVTSLTACSNYKSADNEIQKKPLVDKECKGTNEKQKKPSMEEECGDLSHLLY